MQKINLSQWVNERNQRMAGIDRIIANRPAGLDQQGRHITRPFMAAEACTEIGADEIDPRAQAIFWNAYASIATVAVVAALSLFL